MSGGIDESNAAVLDRVYCQECHHAVRDRDYDSKFIQAGGVLAGPFCGWSCMMDWLIQNDDRIGDDYLEHKHVDQTEISSGSDHAENADIMEE